jgi:hypothetical protein
MVTMGFRATLDLRLDWIAMLPQDRGYFKSNWSFVERDLFQIGTAREHQEFVLAGDLDTLQPAGFDLRDLCVMASRYTATGIGIYNSILGGILAEGLQPGMSLHEDLNGETTYYYDTEGLRTCYGMSGRRKNLLTVFIASKPENVNQPNLKHKFIHRTRAERAAAPHKLSRPRFPDPQFQHYGNWMVTRESTVYEDHEFGRSRHIPGTSSWNQRHLKARLCTPSGPRIHFMIY